MSKNLFILALLACGLAFGARAEAAVDPINPWSYIQPSLDFGNANKIAVGKFNHVHAVFAHADPQQPASDIYYEHFDPLAQVPNQPSAWDEFQLTADTVSYLPALAVDADGMAVAVWVSKPSAQSVLGSIWYRYQTALHCPFCWSTPQRLVWYGTEPSITVENGTVYLAWTTRDRVQLTTFPKNSPPASPLWLGDVVAFTNCPNTKFHQPSIAYVHPPCQPLNVKIAALFAVNEQSSGGSCHDADTHAGPRVYERDNTTTAWSEVSFLPAEVATDSSPNQPDPVPVSISLNANRLTGDFYLAWSDVLDSMARTRLGHGNGTAWDFTQLDALGHHVHVAAQSGGGAGKLRLAVSDQQGWSTGAYAQTGKWSGGLLSWTGAATQIAGGGYPLVENPQALYWSRCASSQLRTMTVYTEADPFTGDGQSDIGTDLSQPVSANCLHIIGDVIAFPHCYQTLLAIGQMVLAGGGEAVLVDLQDSAAVTKLDTAGADLAAFGGGTIHVSWTPGEVLATWDNGFMIATSRGSVRFSSSDADFRVQDFGQLGTAGGK